MELERLTAAEFLQRRVELGNDPDAAFEAFRQQTENALKGTSNHWYREYALAMFRKTVELRSLKGDMHIDCLLKIAETVLHSGKNPFVEDERSYKILRVMTELIQIQWLKTHQEEHKIVKDAETDLIFSRSQMYYLVHCAYRLLCVQRFWNVDYVPSSTVPDAFVLHRTPILQWNLHMLVTSMKNIERRLNHIQYSPDLEGFINYCYYLACVFIFIPRERRIMNYTPFSCEFVHRQANGELEEESDKLRMAASRRFVYWTEYFFYGMFLWFETERLLDIDYSRPQWPTREIGAFRIWLRNQFDKSDRENMQDDFRVYFFKRNLALTEENEFKISDLRGEFFEKSIKPAHILSEQRKDDFPRMANEAMYDVGLLYNNEIPLEFDGHRLFREYFTMRGVSSAYGIDIQRLWFEASHLCQKTYARGELADLNFPIVVNWFSGYLLVCYPGRPRYFQDPEDAFLAWLVLIHQPPFMGCIPQFVEMRDPLRPLYEILFTDVPQVQLVTKKEIAGAMISIKPRAEIDYL